MPKFWIQKSLLSLHRKIELCLKILLARILLDYCDNIVKYAVVGICFFESVCPKSSLSHLKEKIDSILTKKLS